MPLSLLRKIKPLSTQNRDEVETKNKQDTDKIAKQIKKKHRKSGLIPFHLREPITWSKDDVCLWLSAIGLSEYMHTFAENDITGEELVDLEESEFVHLGISKWGHRKKLATKLKALRSSSSSNSSPSLDLSGSNDNNNNNNDNNDNISTSGNINVVNSKSNSSSDEISDIYAPSNELVLKCVVDEHHIQMLVLPRETNFYQLQTQIREQILSDMDEEIRSQKLEIKFKDEEGDLVTVKNDSDFRAAITLLSKSQRFLKLWIQTTEGNPRLTAESSDSSDSPRDESQRNYPSTLKNTAKILDSLVEGAIMINVDGTIIYLNKSVAKMFLYSKKELLGQNISILMPDSIGVHHNEYIQRYLETGVKRVIGTSRKLEGVRKDGKTISLWITVSDFKDEDEGKCCAFIATIRQVQNKNENETKTSQVKNQTLDNAQFYKVMDNLLEAALVTNSQGYIIYANKAAETLLEYTKAEFMDQPLSKLVPSAYLEQDSVIGEYVKSGGEKFVGSCRDAVLQTKSKAIIPVAISVSDDNMKENGEMDNNNNDDDENNNENNNNNGRRYVSIIRERQESTEMEQKTQLQQERDVIDNLALPGIIIDENRIMQGFNGAASKALGFTRNEVLGRNVTMLMPEGEVKRNHDRYVKRYMETGKGRIIGTAGRQITAQSKDGSLVPVWASVTERRLSETKRIFTAILHPKH